MKTLVAPHTDLTPVRIELPSAPARKADAGFSLAALEGELSTLQSAFDELERLKSGVREAQKAFEQACEEEKQLMTNGELPEKDGIRRLIEVRAKKDLRNQRLLEAGKKVGLQCDLIVFDVAEPLRSKFINFANNLLRAKEAEIAKLLTELFPPGHGLRVSVEELVRASAPVTRYRQVANFIRNELATDQVEHFKQLAELPSKWMRSLVELS